MTPTIDGYSSAWGIDFPEDAAFQQLQDEVIACRRCTRLVAWCEEVARTRRRAYRDWEYWGKPIPGFGDPQARILVVGLAPAAHGGNRTGRMFTGDSSGNFLYAGLHRAGFANQPESMHRGDGLRLKDIYIGASCRCAPPDNKPTREEMDNCRPFLMREIELLKNLQGIVALGKIGFDNVVLAFRQMGHRVGPVTFGHNVYSEMGPGLPWLLASYHPSQQNTSTKRLTVEMFDRVWQQAAGLLRD
jgi:uracil-DNA glycosylase family 4